MMMLVQPLPSARRWLVLILHDHNRPPIPQIGFGYALSNNSMPVLGRMYADIMELGVA
jgi:hypothetical protein